MLRYRRGRQQRQRGLLADARELGAKPLAEPATLRTRSGLQASNEGLTFGQRYLARRVAVSELVILPADIPCRTRKRHRRFVGALGAHEGPRTVIAPSVDNGTNALALRPPEAIEMRFGRDSAARTAMPLSRQALP